MAISYTPPSTSNLIGNPSEGGSFSDPASAAELQSTVSSAAAAKVSETAALASKNAAATSETNALASKNAAATSETNALASKNASALSETAAELAETNAETAETNAETAETNALASKNAAASSSTAASNAANAATASQTASAASQISAISSENASNANASNASSSAGAASTSATASATSATASATSATASETSRVASVAAKDLAEDWATKTSSAVEGSNFSAKYYSTVGNVPTVAGSIANVNTVGTNISNVNTVGGISGNVTTVAGIASNVTTVAGIDSNVTTAAGIASNITTVAGISGNVTTVAGINQTHLSNVSGTASNLAIVGTTDAVSDLNTLAAISSDITSLANSLQKTYVVTVSGGVFVLDGVSNPTIQMFRGNSYIFDLSDSSNSGHPVGFKDGSGNSWTSGVTVTGTPGNSGANVTFEVPTNAPNSMRYYCTVHGNGMGNTISVLDSNISLVAASIADINTVAGANSNITSVVGNASNINTVAANSTNINSAVANATNINSAVANATNINSAVSNATNISTVASNISSVNSFSDVYRIASSAPTSSLTAGDLYFDTSSDILKVYGASGWQSAGSSVNGTSARFAYTLTANQTTVTGNDQSGNSLLYDAGFLDVYLNGVKLHSNDFTASSGSSIVLAAGATANDILEVVAFGTFSLSDGTFPGTSAMGTITVTGTIDGRDVATDGTKLDTIETSATADQTDAEIRAAVEAASDSNVFTDADHSKLNAIEASATADQTKSDIEGLGIDLPAANLTGTVAAARLDTATTQAESDDSTKIATTAYVVDKITTLIGGAPSTLNDLNELAAAINDDADYNSTLTTALGTKMPKSGGAFTGAVTTNSTFDGVDIATRDAVLTSTTTTANAALPKSGGTMTGAVNMASTLAFNAASSYASALSIREASNSLIFSGGTGGYYFNRHDNSATDMHINASGNVGIGVTSLQANSVLEVNGRTRIATGSVALPALSPFSDLNTGIFFPAADTLGFSTAGTERMRINSTGIDVTGTATMDGLTVDAGTYHKLITTFPSTYLTTLQIGQQASISAAADTDTVTFAHSGAANVSDFLFTVAGGTKLIVKGTGKVGIGVSNPLSNLDIDVANVTSLGLRTHTGIIAAQYTGAPAVGNRAQIGLGYGNTYTNVSIGSVRTSAAAYGTDDFIIATKAGTTDTAPTERMRISSLGHIKFPNGNLSGYSQTSGNGGTALYADNGSSGGALIQVTNSARGWANFYVNRIWSAGADVRIMQFTINGSGVAGGVNIASASTISFATSSDYRLKENVVYDWDATTRLKQLKPARFNFILDGTDVTQDGFLAHEAQEIVPIAVSGAKDAMKDEEYEVTPAVLDDDGVETEAAVMGTRSVINAQSMDHSKLVPLLVKTIQELEARITALEA
jgi:hypothetical protein